MHENGKHENEIPIWIAIAISDLAYSYIVSMKLNYDQLP